MKKLIDFTDKVGKMVEFVRNQEGHRTFTGTLHSIIAQYYDKHYYDKRQRAGAANNPAASVEDLTPEQMCERVGGKVGIKEGIGVCVFQKPGGGMSGSVPLSNPAGFDSMARRLGILP